MILLQYAGKTSKLAGGSKTMFTVSSQMATTSFLIPHRNQTRFVVFCLSFIVALLCGLFYTVE